MAGFIFGVDTQEGEFVSSCVRWLRAISRLFVRRCLNIVGVSLVAGLVSCQSGLDGVGKNDAKNNVKPPPSTEVQENLGTNGAEITLLVERGPNGYLEGRARDVRDGAALAVGELGEDRVKVKVVPVATGSQDIQAEITAAKGRNSLMVISYASPDITRAAVSVPAQNRPMILNLAAPVSGGGLVNFAIDEVESAVQGAKVAIIGEKMNFLLLTQSDYPSDYEGRVKAGIEKLGGRVVGSLRYQAGGAGVVEALRQAKAGVGAADVVLIAGNTPAAATAAIALKSLRGKADIAFVGTSAWDPQTYGNPAVRGALVMSFDRNNLDLIKDRYHRHFKRLPSDASAYAYDAVAIAAGLARADDNVVIDLQKLNRKSGFTGVSSLFTIDANGATQRRLAPFTVASGRLNLLE